MQEEIENKVVVLIENCTKLTASELRRALEKVLAQVKAGHGQKLPKQEPEAHGKMTVKELAAKDKGMQSIEVNDSNIGSFPTATSSGQRPCRSLRIGSTAARIRTCFLW